MEARVNQKKNTTFRLIRSEMRLDRLVSARSSRMSSSDAGCDAELLPLRERMYASIACGSFMLVSSAMMLGIDYMSNIHTTLIDVVVSCKFYGISTTHARVEHETNTGRIDARNPKEEGNEADRHGHVYGNRLLGDLGL